MTNGLIQNEKQLDLATSALATIEKTESTVTSSAIDTVRESVANFLVAATEAAKESNRLSKVLEESFIEDIENGKMTMTEKITLLNIERSAANDRTTKIISPTFGMITEEFRAKIQADARKEQSSTAVQVNVGGNSLDAQVAATVSPDVGSGLNTLFQLMSSRLIERNKDIPLAEKN